jgi:addiction module HigA family antidote
MKVKIDPTDIPMSIPPGETIAAELEARGQAVQDLAARTGLTTDNIQSIMSGDAAITEDVAGQLGQFFGTSAALWLNLEHQFRQSKSAGAASSASGKIALRLPRSLHERVIHLAQIEGVSMNHCLLSIVAEGVTRHEIRRSR